MKKKNKDISKEIDINEMLMLYEKFQSGKITLRKAAKKADMSISEFYIYILQNKYNKL